MGDKTFLPAKTILFATVDCPEGVDEAKKYASFHNLKKEEIKIGRVKGQVVIEALLPVEMPVMRLRDESFIEAAA